ncbi:MAG: hypothetical protein CL819_09035 [Croceicoccus sp.]|nr:hypothetical protein [Croceicoccus sp.]
MCRAVSLKTPPEPGTLLVWLHTAGDTLVWYQGQPHPNATQWPVVSAYGYRAVVPECLRLATPDDLLLADDLGRLPRTR